MFYPGEREVLLDAVDGYIAAAHVKRTPPKALIGPHAGYEYSGPIAGTAYRTLHDARERITRVIALGPSHRLDFEGIAASYAPAFETPLGSVPTDEDATALLLKQRLVKQFEAAHVREHSIEVHIPFLQRTLSHFTIVPLVVGSVMPDVIDELLEAVWGGPETLIVISSDLSHYLDYESAQRIDALTSRAIEALQPDEIGFDQACGRLPIQGLLLAAKRRGMTAEAIDVRNSGDTAGTRDSVVGYGAYVFHEA